MPLENKVFDLRRELSTHPAAPGPLEARGCQSNEIGEGDDEDQDPGDRLANGHWYAFGERDGEFEVLCR